MRLISTRNEVARAVFSRTFLASVLLQMFLLWLGAREDWQFRDQVDAFYLFALSRENAMFSLFAPMVAVLPYVLTFAADWQQKSVYFQIHRQSRHEYTVSRIAAAVLSGGLAMALGTSFYAVACLFLSPANSHIVEVWRSYADGSWLEPFFRSTGGRGYMCLSIGLDALAGMVWVCVGLMLAIAFRQPIIALLGTQATYLLFLRVPMLSHLYQPNLYFVPAISPGSLSLLQIIGVQLAIIMSLAVFLLLIIPKRTYKLGVNLSMTFKLQRLLRLPFVLKEANVWLVVFPFVFLRPLIFFGNTQSLAAGILHGLGGFIFEDPPTINNLAQWFLLLIPPLMLTSISLRRELSSRIYIVLYRYGRVSSWLRYQFWQQILVCLTYVLAQTALIVVCGLARGVSAGPAVVFMFEDAARIISFETTLLAIPLVIVHLVALCVLLTLLTILMNNSFASIVTTLLLSIGSVWLATSPESNVLLLSCTGMLMRSSVIYPDQVVPALQIAIQILLVTLFAMVTIVAASYNKRFIHQKVSITND